MNKGAYKYLFWGMIYIYLNIHIGYLNILPNFVGYIFILQALKVLSGEIEILNKAKLPTIALIPIGIKDILEQNYLYKLLETQYNIIILKFLNSLEVVLFLYVLYILCQGISFVLRDRGLLKIEKSINNAFKTFFIFSVLVIFCDPFSLNFPLEFGYITIISAIICCIIGLYLGYLFKKIGDAI